MEGSSSHQNSTRAIEDYIFLRRDYKQAIHCVEFQSRGTARYAVDFSEIYVYLLPDAPSRHTSLFNSDGSSSAALFDRAILKHIFAPPYTKLILLAPYAVEFDGFLYKLELSEFENRAETAMTLFDQARAALEQPEFKELTALIDARRESEEELSTEEQQKLLAFLERNAPSIFAFTQDVYEGPHEEALRLLRSDVLGTQSELTGQDEPDLDVYKRWYTALTSRRRRNIGQAMNAQSGIDAMAMAMLAMANETLVKQNKNTRLYLVTRSRTMHDVFEEEFEHRMWSRLGYILLHPRVFSILFSVRQKDQDAALEDLKSKLATVELFLDTVTQGKTFSAGGTQDLLVPKASESHSEIPDSRSAPLLVQEDPQDVVELRNIIRQNWKATEALAIAMAEASSDTSVEKMPTQPDLVEIMSLLRDRGGLLRQVEERLDQLALLLEREYEALGLYYSSRDYEDQGLLKLLRAEKYPWKQVVKHEGPDSKWVVSTETYTMPYTLQFFTPEAIAILGSLTEENGWRKAIIGLIKRSLHVESTMPGSDYEIPLLVAYFLAVLNKWDLAERYCERALSVAESHPNAIEHEMLFFFAISLRKVELPQEERRASYMRALGYLGEASAAKRKWRKDPTYQDPRYLHERGSLILRLNLYYGSSNDYPSPDQGLAELNEALENCQDDKRLRALILNNRLYYCIESRKLTDPDKIRKDCAELFEAQRQVERSDVKWPPAVLDTLARATVLASKLPLSEDQDRKVIRWWRLATTGPQSKEVSSEDINRTRRHFEEYLSQQNVARHREELRPRRGFLGLRGRNATD